MKETMIYAFADEASTSMDGQINALLRNGLNGLEIRGVDGENVSVISLEKAREVRRKLDDHGLITWSVGSPIGKINIDGDFYAHTEVFRHTLEVAQILGAENLRMFSFYMPQNKDPAQYRQKVLDQLGLLLEISCGSNVTLCHENEKGIYGDIADRCLDLHQTFPSLKGIFDPANYVQCGDDTRRAWSLLRPYIRYLHIKDALPNGLVVPAGEGVGHVAEIMKEFLTGGGTAVTLEPHLVVFDGLKELENSDDKSLVNGFAYPSSDAAFDAGYRALRVILMED